MNRHKRFYVLFSLAFIFGYSFWAISPTGMAFEEGVGLEALFKLRGPMPAPEKVVVVAISRHSAEKLHLSDKLYEWSRQHYADLVHNLAASGAANIVFDVYFESKRESQGDNAFADEMNKAGNVLLFARSFLDTIDLGAGAQGELHRIIYADPLFSSQAKVSAPMILPKIPARVNRFYIRHPANHQMWTLPIEAWLLSVSDRDAAMKKLMRMPKSVPLNLYGPPRTITTIDFADAIQQPERFSAILKGSTVFVGYSANSLSDQRDGFYTAYTNRLGLDVSGVEIAATAYANIRDGIYLSELPLWCVGLMVWMYGVLAYLAGRYLAPLAAAITIVTAMALVSALVYASFLYYNLWLPWFHPVLVLTPLCSLIGMWWRGRELFNQRQRLQWAFGKYLPQDELQRLVQQRGLPASREHHHSVCLVTDAQGYSFLSETLSPADLADLMQEYYQALIPAIRQGGGIISDVAGDGVIALWPHVDADKAWQTLRPVIEQIEEKLEKFNQQHPNQTLPTRMGIHAGEIVIGHFGAADHHEFRGMGDIVNTTSRLEGANKQLGTQVLVSECCVDPNDSSIRDLGRYKFVGKANPLRLYSPVKSVPPEVLVQFDQALNLFEKGGYQEAKDLLRSINDQHEDGPSQYLYSYLEQSLSGNVAENIRNDGIITLTRK